MFGDLFLKNSWPFFILRDHNFLISNSILTIGSVSDVPRGGVQILFRHQKQKNQVVINLIDSQKFKNQQVGY
jgi:hypothetical protein